MFTRLPSRRGRFVFAALIAPRQLRGSAPAKGIALLAAAVLALGGSSLHADTITTTVDVRTVPGNGNLAGNTALSLYNNPGNTQATWLNFDFSAYAGKTITSDVTLTLKANTALAGNLLTGVTLGTANAAWTFTGITDANQPATTTVTGVTNPNGTFINGSNVTWTIPAYVVQGWIDNGYNGIGLKSGTTSTLHFDSSRNGGTPSLTFAGSLLNADGTWTSASNGNWTTDSNWLANTNARGIDKTATFNGATGVTVTLDADRTIGNLSFDNANYTISGAKVLTLNVSASSPTITVGSTGGTRTATISTVIMGTDGLTKAGAGTLILSGSANTYTGGTTVSNGALRITGGTGALPGSVAVNSPGILQLVSNATTWGNTVTGTGTVQLEFSAAGASNTSLSNITGFNGTVELTKSTATTGDKWTTGSINAPNVSVIVNSGTQLFVSGADTFSSVKISGTGNSENRGAIRLPNTLNAPVSLLADATIGNEGGTITGGISTGVAGTSTLTMGTSNSNGAATLSGALTDGTGTLALTTAFGTTTLSNSGNSYSGATTVNSGSTLKLGTSNVIPNGAGKGSVALAGTLDLNAASDTINGLSGAGTVTSGVAGAASLTVGDNNTTSTFTGIIQNGSGTVSLVKMGTGTLTLTGANTYTGGTTVSNGVLRIAGGTGSLPGNALVNSPGILQLVSNATTWGNTVTGTGTVQLEFSAAGASNTSLSNITGFNGTVELTKSTATTGDKWTTGSINAPNVSVIVNSGTQLFVSGADTFSSVKISGTGNSENRGAIRLPNTLNAPVSLLADATIGNEGGTITGGISTGVAGTSTLTMGTSNSNGAATLSGALTDGTGTLALTTAFGTTTLSNSGNSYSGATTVNSGSTLKLGTSNVIPNGAGKGSVALAGTLDLNAASDTINGLSGAGTVSSGVAGAASLTVGDNNTTSTFTGIIQNGSGTVSLGKTGTGTLTLTGANTYTGGTTINANSGTLSARVNSGQNSLGTGAVSVGANSTLYLDNTEIANGATTSISNTFTGTGLINLNFAAGTNARNTQMGGVTGFNGTIELSASGATSDKWFLSGGVNAPGATVQVDSGAQLFVNGATSTFLNIKIVGTGNNENRGAIRLNNNLTSPISLQGNATIGNENGTINGGISTGVAGTSTLTMGTSNSNLSATLSGAITDGTGTLALTTAFGTTTLSNGGNSYSGATTVNSGSTLTLGANNVIPNGAGKGSVAVAGTLDLNNKSDTINGLSGAGTVTSSVAGAAALTVGDNNTTSAFSGTIQNGSGTVSLAKIGTGTLTLSGNNSYSGGTDLAAGQLNINSATAIGTGAFTISGVSTIDNTTAGAITLTSNNTQNWNADFTFAGTQSLNMGTGAVTLNAARQVTVSANTLTIGGGVSGAGFDLTKLGGGTLALNGGYAAGTVNVNAGVLSVSGGGDVFNPSTKLINVNNGGTFRYTAANTVQNNVLFTVATGGTLDMNGLSDAMGQLSGGGNITNTGGITLDGFSNASTQNFSGSISGAGAITLRNITGKQIFSGANSYGGATTISSGTLETNVAGGLSTSAVANNSTLNLTGGAITYTFGALSGNGITNITLGSGLSATQFASASWASYTGTLNVGVAQAAGSGKALINNALAAGATVNVNTNSTFYTNAAVTHNASATLFGGDTGESIGQLRLDSGAIWAGGVTLAGNMASGDNIVGTQFGTGTISGIIGETGGARALTKGGSATLVITRANTYTGGTFVNEGTLNATVNSGLNALSTGPVFVNGISTLFLNNTETGNGAATNINNTMTGSGLIQLNFAAGTNPRNTMMPNVTGFTGTIELSNSGSTADKWNAAGINAPNASVQIDSGSQLFVNGAADTFALVKVSGTGNSETRGAIRLPGTLNAPLSLLGSTIIGTEGGTINGNITSGAAGTQTLTFGTTNSTGNTTVNGAIGGGTGTIAVTKTQAGTVTLNGANTYNGDTTVSGGTLVIPGTGSLVTTGFVTVQAGANLSISGAATFSGTTFFNTSGGAGTATIDINSGGVVNNGGSNGMIIGQNTASHNGILNVSGTYKQTASNAIFGNNVGTATGTLNVNNGGLVTFDTTMTNSSTSGAVNASGVVLGRDGATGTINLNAGGILETAKNIIRGTGTGNFNFNGGTLRALASSTNTGLDVTTTTINAGGATIDTQGFSFLVTDAMVAGTGSGGLTKNGTGDLNLTGANTYTGGTQINAGRANLTAAGTYGTGPVTVASGAEAFIGTGATHNNVFNISGDGGTGSSIDSALRGALRVENSTIGASGSVALQADSSLGSYNGNTGTINAVISETGGARALSINKSATATPGTIVLGGANTFSGDTRIYNGTLRLNNILALQNSTVDMNAADAGALSFGTLTSATFGGLKGSRNLSLNNTTPAAVALTVGNNNQSNTYSGQLSGSGSLTKIGTGTQTFTGASTYSGATSVQGGTLELGPGGSIANTSSVTVGASGNGGSDRLLLNNAAAHRLGMGDLVVGSSEAGTVHHNAGNVTVGDNDAGLENVRLGVGANGTYNIGGSGPATLNVGDNGTGNVNGGRGTLTVGDSGGFSGALNVHAGAVINTGDLKVGNGAAGGVVTQDGGTINVLNNSTYTLNASDAPVLTATTNQTGGLTNVTGGMVLGNGVGAATQNQYNLSGGVLDFGDTAGASAHWGAGTSPSSLTINSDATFSLTGTGTLQDVTTINTAGGTGTFTQNGGTFIIGQNEPDGNAPNNLARETTINGGFSLLAGIVRFDAFGPDLTPELCCDGVPSQNDQLTVNGDLLLDSTVSLDFVGFTPEFGDAFTLFCADTITLGDNFGIDGGFFRVIPDGQGGFALQAIVPEPASIAVWTMIGLAGAAAAYRSRKRLACQLPA